MPHKLVNGIKVELTAEEIAARAAEEAAWNAGAFDRAMSSLRQKRDALLKSTDYLALSDNTLSAEMTTYRQALRDITNGLTTVEQVNAAFKKASQEKRFKGILGVEDLPLVSSDYAGNSFSSVVDLPSTKAIDNLVKVLSWYDNEWGYACRFADFAEFIGKKI